MSKLNDNLREAAKRDGSYRGNLGSLMNDALGRIVRLEAALITAKERFNEYQEHHLAKTPPDVEKAVRNCEMVEFITAILKPTDG